MEAGANDRIEENEEEATSMSSPPGGGGVTAPPFAERFDTDAAYELAEKALEETSNHFMTTVSSDSIAQRYAKKKKKSTNCSSDSDNGGEAPSVPAKRRRCPSDPREPLPAEVGDLARTKRRCTRTAKKTEDGNEIKVRCPAYIWKKVKLDRVTGKPYIDTSSQHLPQCIAREGNQDGNATDASQAPDDQSVTRSGDDAGGNSARPSSQASTSDAGVGEGIDDAGSRAATSTADGARSTRRDSRPARRAANANPLSADGVPPSSAASTVSGGFDFGVSHRPRASSSRATAIPSAASESRSQEPIVSTDCAPDLLPTSSSIRVATMTGTSNGRNDSSTRRQITSTSASRDSAQRLSSTGSDFGAPTRTSATSSEPRGPGATSAAVSTTTGRLGESRRAGESVASTRSTSATSSELRNPGATSATTTRVLSILLDTSSPRQSAVPAQSNSSTSVSCEQRTRLSGADSGSNPTPVRQGALGKRPRRRSPDDPPPSDEESDWSVDGLPSDWAVDELPSELPRRTVLVSPPTSGGAIDRPAPAPVVATQSPRTPATTASSTLTSTAASTTSHRPSPATTSTQTDRTSPDSRPVSTTPTKNSAAPDASSGVPAGPSPILKRRRLLDGAGSPSTGHTKGSPSRQQRGCSDSPGTRRRLACGANAGSSPLSLRRRDDFQLVMSPAAVQLVVRTVREFFVVLLLVPVLLFVLACVALVLFPVRSS